MMNEFSTIKILNEDISVKDTTSRFGVKLFNETRVSNLRTFVLIGDSYGLTTTWWNSWQTQFESITGLKCYKSAVGGSGFVGDQTVDNFKTQLMKISSSVADRSEVTDVIVLGGYNDASTSTSVANLTKAISEFKNESLALFPNGRISIGFIGIDYTSNGMQAKLANYCNYYRDVALSTRCCFIENIQYTLINKSLIFISSGNPNSMYHPTSEGNKQVAYFLAKYIYNGNANIIYGENLANIQVYLKNGDINIFSNDGYGFKLPAGSYPFNSWVTLRDLSTTSNLLWGTNNTNTCFTCCLNLIQNDGKNLGIIMLRIYDKKIQINNLGNVNPIVVVQGAYTTINTINIPYGGAF